MKKLIPFVLVAALVIGGLYYVQSGGSLSKKGPSGGKLPTPPNVHGVWDQILGASWFYPLLAAIVVVMIIAFLWGKIGVWGQRAVMLAVGILIAYVAVKGGYTK